MLLLGCTIPQQEWTRRFRLGLSVLTMSALILCIFLSPETLGRFVKNELGEPAHLIEIYAFIHSRSLGDLGKFLIRMYSFSMSELS
jgi:hypothetical protein